MFYKFLQLLHGRQLVPLPFETPENELKKDEGLYSRDVSFSICMTKHQNLARIQAFPKRPLCICLGLTKCNR